MHAIKIGAHYSSEVNGEIFYSQLIAMNDDGLMIHMVIGHAYDYHREKKKKNIIL